MSNAFDLLDSALDREGESAVLMQLANQLRSEQRFHELFEALKMKLRSELGLPLLYQDSGDELDESVREKLEDGLVDACRDVGLSLLAAGRIRDAWIYLRPVGDNRMVKAELAKLEPSDENLDELIEVCLHEGLDLERGFRLLLGHYGTCNTITTFESTMHGRTRQERAIGAQLLLRHLSQELLENVRAHIEQREPDVRLDEKATLADLIAHRAWLFEGGSYHVDTTHLSSVVRFARELDDQPSLEMALDLALYGQQLDSQLQYPADEPFQDFYQAHLLFFRALLNDQPDAAVRYFRQKAQAVNPREDSTMAIEVYVDLLARLGRHREAITESRRLIPAGIQTTGLAPSMLELSEACGDYEALKASCRERNELLGYAIGLLHTAKE